MEDDYLNDVTEACGKAIGFTLAAAFRSPELFRTNAGVMQFKESIEALKSEDRFSPEVTLVMIGVAQGLAAFVEAKPTTSGEFV